MYLNSKTFWLLVLISIVLIVIYQWGIRKNISLSRKISKLLEKGLKPKDTQYTWLGGVLGFSATYTVDGFEKVEAILRLFPRHSLLYLPFALLRGSSDTLQILLYLKNDPQKYEPEEFHLIKKGHNVYVEDKDQFKEKELLLADNQFILLYKDSPPRFLTENLINQRFYNNITHIAYTHPEKVFYAEIKACSSIDIPSALSNILQSIKN